MLSFTITCYQIYVFLSNTTSTSQLTPLTNHLILLLPTKPLLTPNAFGKPCKTVCTSPFPWGSTKSTPTGAWRTFTHPQCQPYPLPSQLTPLEPRMSLQRLLLHLLYMVLLATILCWHVAKPSSSNNQKCHLTLPYRTIGVATRQEQELLLRSHPFCPI